MNAQVVAVHSKAKHTFSKSQQASIMLLAGLGVADDAHCGATVKHRSRVMKDPTQANLRQVHLIHSELFTELEDKGFSVTAGQLGENITTANIDLLSLPRDTILRIGEKAAIRITGLRNPCGQIEAFQSGLLAAVLDKDASGNVIRKAGIMAVVLQGGEVKPMDPIVVELPREPYQQLERV